MDLNNFSETAGSLAGAGNVTLESATLTAGGDNASTTFSGVISGSGALVKMGTGALALSGANTFTGGSTAESGMLIAQNAAALGSSSAGTTVDTGAELQIASGITMNAMPLTLNGTGTVGQGALRGTGGNTSWTGSITLGSNATIGADSGQLKLAGAIATAGNTLTFLTTGDIQVDGAIEGSGGVVKAGAGTLTLTGANTFTGGMTINAGAVVPESSSAFGGTASPTTVAAGAAIQLNVPRARPSARGR